MARNVSSNSILAHRAIIVLILFLSLYGYSSLKTQIATLIERSNENLQACNDNAYSILTTLEVFHQHKVRMSTLYKRITDKSEKEISSLKNRLDLCQEKSEKAKNDFEASQDFIAHSNQTDKRQEKDDYTELKELVKNLKSQIIDKEQIMMKQLSELTNAKNSLKSCERMIEQYVGAVPVAHYTQNETASFDRKHKIGQELSFDRGAIEEHGVPKILNENQLRLKLEEARRLKEKKEEDDDLHPDDRAREDEYVNEIKDPDERDYKDGN